MPNTARVREDVAKALWYRAGGRCAFAHKQELSISGSDRLFGRVAHIVARSSGGPRGDSTFPPDKLNECDNLILLCPEHHDEVDKELSRWTVERLRQLKQQHEGWVRNRLKWADPRDAAPGRAGRMLVVLWGPSSVGKDVVLNRLLLRLEQQFPAMNLQRFTTRGRRPEEAESTPFQYLTTEDFFDRVSKGEIACVHSTNDTFYGFDSQFGGSTPAGTVILTCMRQFHYLTELSARAAAAGLSVYNVLLTADYDTVHNRTLQRGTRQQEKHERLRTLRDDVKWFAANQDSGSFDLAVDNSDNASLNRAVEQVYEFVLQRLEGAAA